MKRLIPVLLLLLTLTGCAKGLYPNEYVYQAEHAAPFAYKETETVIEETEAPIPIAADYYSIRRIIRGFILAGVEHGQFQVNTYEGDLEQDLRRVTNYFISEDPVSAYAADYINCEREETTDGWLIRVDTVYRRSAGEIASIRSVRGNDAAVMMMQDALTQQQTSVTLQVSGFTGEDFSSLLTDYCLQHPDEIPEIPQISVSAYPDSGYVRVVEVHFIYQNDRETQRNMKNEVVSVLNSAYSYVRYAGSDQRKLQLLFSYLTSRFPYTEAEEDATVYSLLCQGVGDSRSFASAVRYLCERAGIEAYLVQGERNDAPYYWNIVYLDGVYYHCDFQADALSGDRLRFRLDDNMKRYAWDRDAYPVCSRSEPEETTDPTETTSP